MHSRVRARTNPNSRASIGATSATLCTRASHSVQTIGMEWCATASHLKKWVAAHPLSRHSVESLRSELPTWRAGAEKQERQVTEAAAVTQALDPAAATAAEAVAPGAAAEAAAEAPLTFEEATPAPLVVTPANAAAAGAAIAAVALAGRH